MLLQGIWFPEKTWKIWNFREFLLYLEKGNFHGILLGLGNFFKNPLSIILLLY